MLSMPTDASVIMARSKNQMNDDIAQVIQQTAAVLKASGAKEVYVFGSAARGTMQEGSDVDFAVAGLPPQEFFKALSAAGRISPGPLDLVDLDEITPFTRYLKEEGELRRVA